MVVLRDKRVVVAAVMRADKRVFVLDKPAVQSVEILVAGKLVRKQVREQVDRLERMPDFPADKACFVRMVQF